MFDNLTKREKIYLILVLIVLLTSLVQASIYQIQVKEQTKFYIDQYYDCVRQANSYADVYNRPIDVGLNLTLS